MTGTDESRLERTLTEFRIEVAAALGEIKTRLEPLPGFDLRLRKVENECMTREATASAITAAGNAIRTETAAAIEAAKRPAWKDIGAILSIGLVVAGLAIAIWNGVHG